jgi:tRNA A-37 threonylcarbamoyl transferase component Bud32/tetratricopeptide (TPR) repeat protein
MSIRVEELFHDVADLSAEARERFFAEHDVDAVTRREVEALLAFDCRSSMSLESDIGQVAQGALARIEHQDIQCGPYKLGDLLGRGGMGTVYLAERVDGEVAHRVAVKVLRPGADDPRLRQRFLSERQILATLSHPNIARLLDAGHREDGQPYLVMEYVEGKTIDVYTTGFGIKQKVTLFLKVCAAVGYLHRNLVVHRDLKPPNILVTKEGDPKLLDFGIAKMLDLSTDSTVTAMRMLTPDYASPEQVAGGPVTTATDIYSLGAVLYKILTGASPHQFEGDSVEAIVLAVSAGRIAPPSKLAPGLKGDLEMIVMKALRKEPQERYATIEQLSEDLESYLQSGPIRARKGDAWYRTRKFLRRYWLPVAAASLAMAGLATGLGLANRERAIAQRRFMEVRQLASKLFDIDAEARKIPGSVKTRQLIVDTALEYLQRLSADVHDDSELALEVGNAYLRVARVQGVPSTGNLGQMDQAAHSLQFAEGFIQSVLASQPSNRTAILRSAQIAHDRMVLARFNGRDEEALALARKTEEWLEKFHPGKGDQSEANTILSFYSNIADQQLLGGRLDDALRLSRRGSGLARLFDRPANLGSLLWASAFVYRLRGDLDQALSQIRESVKVLEPGPGNAEQGRAMNFALALIYESRILADENGINLARPEEALASLERAFSIADSFVHRGPDDQHPRARLAMAGLGMAEILRHSDARRALEIYDHVLHHLAEIRDNSAFRRYGVSALAGSIYPLRRLGRTAEARQRLDAAFERLRQLKVYPAEKIKPGSEPDEALCALADYEAGNGNIPKAIGIYEELLEKIQAAKLNPETNLLDAVDMSRVYSALVDLHRRARQPDAAAVLEARRLELWRHWDARLPHNNFVRRKLDAASQQVQ